MEVAGTLKHWQPSIGTGAKESKTVSSFKMMVTSVDTLEISNLAILNILQKFLFVWCVITRSHLLALHFMFFCQCLLKTGYI